uniref:ribosomal L1 domain-containing protein 1 isoform X2 n=1 Tax=Myxine glutinosa TaxID=7769 RepID=UPI00358FD528
MMEQGGLDEQQVRLAVIALREHTLKDKAKAKGNSRQLLLAEEEPIRLIITPWRIPKKARSIKVWLPNQLRSETAEVCLFTKDEAATGEETERHYRQLLDSRGVKGITKVMAFHTLKKEYKAFEAKRKLASSFDLFLTDARIARLLPSHIGKHFYQRKKAPMSVNMKLKDLNAEIQRFVGGTRLIVSNKGSCSSVHVAHIGMSVDMVIKNVMAANASIIRRFPLGWKNVKMVHLKTKSSITLPIYMALPKQLFGVALKNILKKKVQQNSDDFEQEKVAESELSVPKKKAKLKDQHANDRIEGNTSMAQAVSSAKPSILDSTKTMEKSLKSKKYRKTPCLKGSPSEPRGTTLKLESPNSSTPTLLSKKVNPPQKETVPTSSQNSVQDGPKSLTKLNLDCSEMESLGRGVKMNRDLYSELEVEVKAEDHHLPPVISDVPFPKTPRPVKSKKTPQSSKSAKSSKSFKLKHDVALASKDMDVQAFDTQSPKFPQSALAKSPQKVKLKLELACSEAKSPIAVDEELVMEVDARNYPSPFSVASKSVSPKKLMMPRRAMKDRKASPSSGFEETLIAPLETVEPSPKSAQRRAKAKLDGTLLRTPKPVPDSSEDDPKASDLEKFVAESSQAKSELESFTVTPKTTSVQKKAKSPRASGSLSRISPMTLRSGKKKMTTGCSDVKLLASRSERKMYCSPLSNPFKRSLKSPHRKI